MTVQGASGLHSALVGEVMEQVEDAGDIATSLLLDAAIRRSSGPWSQDQLDQADNPYAKRHGHPLLDPSMANVQTGAFRAAWQSLKLSRTHWQVVNADPVGRFLVTPDGQGTKFMFHRGVDEGAVDDVLRRMPALSRS